MNSTVILAQILGILFAVLGISVVINKKNLARAIEEIIQNQGFLWFFGFIMLTMGAVLIALNNAWGPGLVRLFITIVGWLSLLKGAFILIFPSSTVSLYRKVNKGGILLLGGLIVFVIGLLLLYKGFIM